MLSSGYVTGMVPMKEIRQYCKAIGLRFAPRKIILFGSHAYGQPHADSDVDVLVVMRNAGKLGRQPAVTIRSAVRAGFPVDLLVRDEREVERRLRNRDSFMLDIVERGKVLYEAIHA